MPPAKLSVSDVVNRVAAIYRDQAAVLLPTAFVVFLLEAVVASVLIAASPGLLFLAIVVQVIATTFYDGMVVGLVADVRDGRRDSSVGALLRAVSPVFGPLLLVGIISGLGIALGFALLILPGLFLLTIWSVAGPVVIVERAGALNALGRSRGLVAGNGWPVFGVIVLFFLVVLIAGFVLGGFGAAAGTVGRVVASVIANTLAAPLAALAAAVVYFELRDVRASGSGTAPGVTPDPGP